MSPPLLLLLYRGRKPATTTDPTLADVPRCPVDIPEVTVLSSGCSALSNDKITYTVEFCPDHSHASKVNLLVDSGSSVSILAPERLRTALQRHLFDSTSC